MPLSLANRNCRGVKIIQTIYVDAIVIRLRTFSMESVDSATSAEVVLCNSCIPLILGQTVTPGEKLELGFMHLGHQRVFLGAKRAVASREL